MRLVALVKRPPTDASVLLAEATGMALAEARMRLAPEPPTLLARLAEGAAAELVTRLRQAGLAALHHAEDAALGEPRVEARTFRLEASGLHAAPRSGAGVELPWDDVSVILKGTRAFRTGGLTQETTKKLSLSAAVITGGLVMSKKVSQRVDTRQEDLEHVLFVFSRSGACAVLAERMLDFSCLGDAMQPVRMANMATLAKQLCAHAPQAFYDERLVRLGTRSLPFAVLPQAPGRANTSSALELLAALLFQGVQEGLLP